MRFFFIFFFVLDFFVINKFFRNQSFADNPNTCAYPIARVVNTDHPIYRFGFPICANRVLQISETKPIKVVCRYNTKIIVLRKLSDLLACPSNQYKTQPDFETEVVRGSPKTVPILLHPYGLAIRKPQVLLEWKPVVSTGYLVTIDDGLGNFKSFKTSQSNLLINSLKGGESYQIIVYSNRGKSINVLRVLSDNENEKLTSMLVRLDAQKKSFSSEEWFNFRLALFNQYDLLDESIEFASSQLNQHPENLEISRTLGDLFVSASRPDDALSSYQRFLTLAQHKKSDSDVLAAQRRIQFVLAKLGR